MPRHIVYSTDRRRWWAKSYSRNTAITSATGHAFSTGIIPARSSANGVCTLSATCTLLSASRRRSDGRCPTVLTVMRFGLHASPHDSVSTRVAASTASKLSSGSPMPMNTMFVRESLSGMDKIWFTICAAERLPWNPCRPVMQKVQPMRHPACELTHNVARSRSGMYTASMSRPPAPRNRYLAVPSVLRLHALGVSLPQEVKTSSA